MEVSDCTSIPSDVEVERPSTSGKPSAPQGLSGVPDSIQHIHSIAPKPNFLKRTAIAIGLVLIHMLTWVIQFSNWVLKNIFGISSRQKTLYRELHSLSMKGDMGKIEEFLIENSTHAFVAGYLFSEFLDLPELHPYFSEILQGANVCLYGDRGFFCRRWSEHPECYKRLSSHDYQNDECYSIGHLLFWKDSEGDTRFQFENSPLKGFFSSINHLIDYLRYKKDNEQQGVVGTSMYTEDFCIKVEVNPLKFMVRTLQ